MKCKKYKPGPGWFYYSLAPVCEHSTGIRIHAAGMYRKTTGDIQEIPWPELSKYRRVCGGNRKRAVMAWVSDHVL